MRIVALLVLLALAVVPSGARDLQLYFIDVEGGQATLIVSPSGESMLVDAGWPSRFGPGAERIAAAAKQAGIEKIDYLLVTHYHLDHVGGVPEVAARMAVGTYIDHGPDTETDALSQRLWADYEKAREKGKHLVVKPGDRIPLEGVDIEVVAARGETIGSALKGAGAANQACAAVKPQANDPTENARSVAFLLDYGKFRFADFGDLTWNKENALVCPKNLLGRADLYLVTHHGMDISNSPAMLAALHPRVAIMNNGAKKGGASKAFDVVRSSAGLEDLWQLHTALGAGGANSAEQLVANPEAAGCQGHWIQVTARADGSFTVVNERNGYTKNYGR
jgi:competence protein ComEC